MKNEFLAKDYFTRSKKRLKALDALFEEQAWADVVREAQEIVELSLKGLLRLMRVEVPRLHDVSDLLRERKEKLPASVKGHLDKICEISRKMRRDRELSFYGSEDLTPSEFYRRDDAKTAREEARFVVETLSKTFGEA